MAGVAPPSGRPSPPPPAGPSSGAPGVNPFVALARTHATSIAGDTMVAVALAGSLFFSIDPAEARWRVALYLLVTLAPFAVVAPLIGPAIDAVRSGSRWVILGTAVTRAGVCLLMARHIDGLLVFPEAFTLLVMGKAYAVAKSAHVPNTVSGSASLVTANSRLALLGAVAAPVGALPAFTVAVLAGSAWVVVLAATVFVATAVLAVQLPPGGIGPARGDNAATRVVWRERPTLVPSVWLGASGMGLVRLLVGFMTFLLAFELRKSEGTAGFGLVLAATGAAAFAGAWVAPVLRRHVLEERLLAGALGGVALGGLLGAVSGGLTGSVVVAASVGMSAAIGRQAFDALVQRDTPGADVGRVFAQSEARFQVLWVVGGFAPVVLPIPARVGFLLIAGLGGLGVASFLAGRHWFDLDRLRAFAGFVPEAEEHRGGRAPTPVREEGAGPAADAGPARLGGAGPHGPFAAPAGDLTGDGQR